MKFSIIICTYNAEKKLPKTLDSIFLQTDNDYEVIIIDGASSDGTVDIVKDAFSMRILQSRLEFGCINS